MVDETNMRMSPDLRHAAVFVKPLLGKDEAVVLKALRTNTAFFQREVAKRLGLKFAPKLQFKPDESFDEAERIELQKRLTAMGYDTGGTDGRTGSMTAAAVSAFQAARGMTVDGIPDRDVLLALR